MAIPNIQSIMLPLLQLAADNDTLRFRDAVDLLADRLRLTEAERREVMSSGTTRLYYRVSFARRHLKKAGLVEDPSPSLTVCGLNLADLGTCLPPIH